MQQPIHRRIRIEVLRDFGARPTLRFGQRPPQGLIKGCEQAVDFAGQADGLFCFGPLPAAVEFSLQGEGLFEAEALHGLFDIGLVFWPVDHGEGFAQVRQAVVGEHLCGNGVGEVFWAEGIEHGADCLCEPVRCELFAGPIDGDGVFDVPAIDVVLVSQPAGILDLQGVAVDLDVTGQHHAGARFELFGEVFLVEERRSDFGVLVGQCHFGDSAATVAHGPGVHRFDGGVDDCGLPGLQTADFGDGARVDVGAREVPQQFAD